MVTLDTLKSNFIKAINEKNNMGSRFSLRLFLLLSIKLLLISAFILSCSESVSNNEVTFSGTVTLEGETDFSGVTVSLYEPVELDTALVRINEQYPNIGVQISQETEFDHRAVDSFDNPLEAVATTTTSADGSWQIKVEEGVYNVVVEKEGFGWKYEYEAEYSKDLSSVLKPEIVLSGEYFNSLQIAAYSFVLIESKTIFNFGTILQVEKGSIIRFDEDCKIEIKGEILLNGTSDEPIHFISKMAENYGELSLKQTTSFMVNNTIFRDTEFGIFFSTVSNGSIEKVYFRGNKFGIGGFNSSNIDIKNCAFIECEDGVNLDKSSFSIQKNIFYHNSNGILSQENSNTTIKNNLFEKSQIYGVSFNFGRSPGSYTHLLNHTITFNDFAGNNEHLYVGRIAKCITNNNNFYTIAGNYVVTDGISYVDTLDFKNNYWSTIDGGILEQKIIDKNDRIGSFNEGPIVNYTEFSANPIVW
ncbi:MAG: hypothetical protein D8M58_04400 [Calditrichaeota bacterium]|nr:MAG: hypothetical protein DWQ03_02675 [Calditrichota bacterium]MBL1204611.1 hypothetical protein [Calditrichota bacterium]NOG44440.1 hypothetical protein [Calditrichota bacterium]